MHGHRACQWVDTAFLLGKYTEKTSGNEIDSGYCVFVLR